jgi:hypothetical protein
MRMSATICMGTDVSPWAHLGRPAMTEVSKAPAICVLLVMGPCLLSFMPAEQQYHFTKITSAVHLCKRTMLTGRIKQDAQQQTALLQSLHKHCICLAYGKVSRWSCFIFCRQANHMSNSRSVQQMLPVTESQAADAPIPVQ